MFVKQVKALQSSKSCTKLSGLLVGEYTPRHTDRIVYDRVSNTFQSRAMEQEMADSLILSLTQKAHRVYLVLVECCPIRL